MDHIIDDSDRLKRCPFCGEHAEYGIVAGDENAPDVGGHFIGCINDFCGASTVLIFPTGEDPKETLFERWNRRPSAPDQECDPGDICAGCRCTYGAGTSAKLTGGPSNPTG